VTPWYAYALGPIDWFAGTTELADWVRSEEDEMMPDNREEWRRRAVLVLAAAIRKTEGRIDLAFRMPHRVGVLPVDGECLEPYLIAKLDNNGTTYVVASRALPHLGDPVHVATRPGS
jgi:di/tricarboxylate transporter